jgi:hypothetical protein
MVPLLGRTDSGVLCYFCMLWCRSAAYGTPFMRAPYTHSPTYQATVPGIGTIRSTMGYVIPQSGPRPHSTQGYGVVPGSRPWQPAPASLEQQELYKLRNLKAAMQAASREAAITNTWRAQKVQEYKDAELAMENEAFDRYMLNMSLLEEVLIPVSAITGLSSEGELLVQDGEATDENRDGNVSDTLMLVDGMRVHQGEIRARKEASRQRMRRTVERHLLTLKRGGQQESFNHEDDELIQVGIPGWQQDFKRFKATTKEGKECLERVELFESLVQKTNLIQTRADIDACGDFYRQNFGHGLDILLPHLSHNVEHLYGAKLRKDENYCSAATLSDLEPEKGNKGQKVSPSKDSHARSDTDTSESAKREREEALQKEDERELTELEGQDPEQSKAETKSPAGEEMMDHKRIPNEVSSANEERNIEFLTKETGELEEGDKQRQPNWPRLHEGFLKGRGWWKVEADEYSTQIVCQQFLNSSHTVEAL